MAEEREQRPSVGDDTLNEVADAGRDDYLTADRMTAIDSPSGVDAPEADEHAGPENESENPEASTYGAP